MNDNNPKQARYGVPIILTIPCLLSGLYSRIQLAKFLPVWLAVIITLAVGLILVGSLTASLGNDLLDIGIGCIVVVIVMAVALPVAGKIFRRHFSAAGSVEQVTPGSFRCGFQPGAALRDHQRRGSTSAC
jgi:hypothetical protein